MTVTTTTDTRHRGVKWMRAGNGVWHTGMPVGDGSMLGFQLWVALPVSEENAPAESQYLALSHHLPPIYVVRFG